MRAGPPVFVSDKHALPLPAGATHVAKLWFMEGGVTETAKLDGAVEGEERQKLWNNMKSFIATVEGRDKNRNNKESKKGTETSGESAMKTADVAAQDAAKIQEVRQSAQRDDAVLATPLTSLAAPSSSSSTSSLHSSSSSPSSSALRPTSASTAAAAVAVGGNSLKWRFLLPALLFRASNWLQGPYFYALYSNKHAVREELQSYGGMTTLYVSGYIASLTAGTFIGSLTDRCGRRQGCLLCGLAFAFTCLSVHSEALSVLLAGRVTAGIGSTLLHSAFEAWLVGESARVGGTNWRRDVVSPIISSQTTLNSVLAIVSGVIATFAVDKFGITGASDLALILLILGMVFILATWAENRGRRSSIESRGGESDTAAGAERSTSTDTISSATPGCENSTTPPSSSRRSACAVLRAHPSIAVLGFVQVAYEGTMHVFITLWPEILEKTLERPQNTLSNLSAAGAGGADPDDAEVKFKSGLIFSGFMLCVTVGSTVFSAYNARKQASHVLACTILLAIGAAALLMPIFLERNFWATLVSFFLFELTAGAYHPCVGLMRTELVPTDVSASMITLFRVPQNIFVVMLLLMSRSDDTVSTNHTHLLGTCGCVLLVALVCLVSTFGVAGKMVRPSAEKQKVA
jgi:MFS family permease